MSDTSPLQDTLHSTDANQARNSPNTGRLSNSSSTLYSAPESPETAQIISYIPQDSNSLSPLQNRKNDHSNANGSLPGRPCGPCYTRDELLHLRKSPLVAPPAGMPARKEWYGYVSLLSSLPAKLFLIVDPPENIMNSQVNQRTTMDSLLLAQGALELVYLQLFRF